MADILGAIANPQMADIAGAIDYREQKMARDEAKRKQIRMNELMGKALSSGLKEGSVLHTLATQYPEGYMATSKAMGIDPADGSGMHQMSQDVYNINMLNNADPTGAKTLEFMESQRAKRSELGLNVGYFEKGITAIKENAGQFMRASAIVNNNLNPAAAKESFTLGDTRYDGQGNVIASNPKGEADGSGDTSMHIKNLREYKKLKDAGDPEAEPFAQMVNLKSREGKELTSGVTKIIDDLTEENKLANYNVTRYSSLSKKIRNADYAAGVKGKSQEAVKSFFGNQDETTALKKELALIRNSEALKQLPAGSASEKDVELVMEPMPDQNSDPVFVADWLDSYSKVSSGIAKYTEAKSDFIATHGSVRDKDGNTFIKAWKTQNKPDHQKELSPEAATTEKTGQETAAQRLARLTGGK